jgi:hypothetical protein
MTFPAALTVFRIRWWRPFAHRERRLTTEREAHDGRVVVTGRIAGADPLDWQSRAQADLIMHCIGRGLYR